MRVEELISNGRPFLEWAVEWYNDLERVPLDSVIGDPERAAVLSVDVTWGFCRQGPLASERVGTIVQPIVKLFEAVFERGVRHLVLLEDHHSSDAVEFTSFPRHCVAGTGEAQTVPEFVELAFFDQFAIMEKNSISSFIGTGLGAWLEARPDVNTFIVVGDCTDLCTHQLAMYLRLRANALQSANVRVVLPVDCVQTYDVPVAVAREIGAVPHDGDLLHLIFLYSLMLNGVQVVAGLGD